MNTLCVVRGIQMCGKYYADREFIPRLSTLFKENDILTDPELKEEWDKVLYEDSRDVSPTDSAVTISLSSDGLFASKMKWGFRDPYHDSLVINARAETASEKQMFRESVRERRCVIPASGYYEWDPAKARYRFRKDDGGLILLAGIYRSEQGEPHYTILTTQANECMKPVHDRMPVTVSPEEIRPWITDMSSAAGILARRPEELLRIQDSGQISMELGI